MLKFWITRNCLPLRNCEYPSAPLSFCVSFPCRFGLNFTSRHITSRRLPSGDAFNVGFRAQWHCLSPWALNYSDLITDCVFSFRLLCLNCLQKLSQLNSRPVWWLWWVDFLEIRTEERSRHVVWFFSYKLNVLFQTFGCELKWPNGGL